jgi:hypothetical protein
MANGEGKVWMAYCRWSPAKPQSGLEIAGHCILISDQTLAPFHLRLRIAPGDANEISWLELSVGERGANGMVRQPYNSGATSKRTYALPQRLAKIDWAYQVTFGDRAE